jgi:AraC-like DNA-binding protein
VILLRGSGSFYTRTRSLPFNAHQMLIIPPWLPHGFDATLPSEHIALHFDLAAGVPPIELTKRSPYEVRLAPALELPLVSDLKPEDGIEPTALSIIREWSGATPAGRLAAQSRLALLLAQMARSRDPVVQGGGIALAPSGIPVAVELMRANFADPLTMGDCARIAGLSTTRFAHRFRDLTGYAPMEYLRRLRIDAARRLLADGSLSIKQVGARCGYPDPYHFSRVFRSLDGLSPTLFREAILAGRVVADPEQAQDTDASGGEDAASSEPS